MKDPAALVYIDKWIAATKGMKGAEKGWYFDLILSQFDKGDIPNDIDELSGICSVRPSEYVLFEQVFEQVLKQKFEQNESGRLENMFAREIIVKRGIFRQKRIDAGKMSYILRYFRKKHKLSKGLEDFIKSNIDLSIDIKSEQVLEQVFEQMSELYIDVDVDINRSTIKSSKPKKEYTDEFLTFWEAYPRKTGKGAAYRAWKSVRNRPDTTKLIESLELHKLSSQWSKDGGQFIPNPSTWLNQSRWEDEVNSFNGNSNAVRPPKIYPTGEEISNSS